MADQMTKDFRKQNRQELKTALFGAPTFKDYVQMKIDNTGAGRLGNYFGEKKKRKKQFEDGMYPQPPADNYVQPRSIMGYVSDGRYSGY